MDSTTLRIACFIDGQACHARHRQEVNFLRFWEQGFSVFIISQQRCSFQGWIQAVVEKFKENTKLMTHGNGTEHLPGNSTD